ncbi:MAG: hypothetical protein L3J20_11275 [Flavobacteriaceae bacterium]|nr:hypothetical protein [Flavobacteriaceae bacterium]
MKVFIKILIAFLFLFFIGIYITYKNINNTFKKVEKVTLVYYSSNTVLDKTFQVI